MARLKNDPGITKTNNEPIMTKPHWVDCNIKWLRNFNGYCLIVMFRFKSCSSVQKNFLRGLSLVVEREEATRRRSFFFTVFRSFSRCFRKFGQKQNIYFPRKGRLPESKAAWFSLNCLILHVCQWSERMYLCGFVALYVRMSVARANKVEGTMS